jgi:hypothetical protein
MVRSFVNPTMYPHAAQKKKKKKKKGQPGLHSKTLSQKRRKKEK